MSTVHALSRNDQVYYKNYEGSPLAENELSRDGLAVTEAEYWEKYYNDPDFVYEWNNGCLEVKPMSDVKGSDVYQWFCDILRCWIRTYPIGKIINLDIGFRLALPHKTSIRRPDLSMVLDTNPVAIDDDDRTYSGTFDFCVESLSHSTLKELKRDTVDKKKEYEGSGVREYYILDARKNDTAFYSLGKNGKYRDIGTGSIIKSAILPGFQFRLSDLYRQPPLEELAEDEIYHSYVFPSYKKILEEKEKEKLRADKAENLLFLEQLRADKEKQLKEKEQLRADKEKQLKEKEQLRADKEKQLKEKEQLRADKEKQLKEKEQLRADKERQLKEKAEQRAEQLAAKLKALGIAFD
ncbi:Uma2 family endonuclease [Desulfobacterales bacterium HSG16]|nr:Uma2 family endonuclease [Desulfobacterales bacterium HSG16]